MKTRLCSVLWSVLIVAALPAGWAAPLKQGERDRALSELHATRKQFLDATAGLSAAQWNFKPAAGAWSVGEIAEHLAVAEEVIFQRVKSMLQGAADPGKKSSIADEKLLEAVEDRSHKIQTSDALVPKHRWATQQEVVEHFRERRDRTLGYVRETSDELRQHFATHPVFGELDAYQWIMLMAGHTARHVQQMDEVRRNPNFPKK